MRQRLAFVARLLESPNLLSARLASQLFAELVEQPEFADYMHEVAVMPTALRRLTSIALSVSGQTPDGTAAAEVLPEQQRRDQLALVEALISLVRRLVEVSPTARTEFTQNSGFGLLIMMLHSMELRSSAAFLIEALGILLADREPLLVALIGILRRFKGGAGLATAEQAASGLVVSTDTCFCVLQCLTGILVKEPACKQVFGSEGGPASCINCIQQALMVTVTPRKRRAGGHAHRERKKEKERKKEGNGKRESKRWEKKK